MAGPRNDSFVSEDQPPGSKCAAGHECFVIFIRARLPKTCPAVSISVVLVVVLFLFDSSTLQAGMYVCRDQSGAINFTNVRNSPDCEPLELKKEGTWAEVSHSSEYLEYTETYGSSDSSRYDREIRRIGRRYNVDPSLIKAIIHTESDFDDQAVSRAGAQGLMQLMPGTARQLQVADPFDPKENIDGGTRYFRSLLDNFNEDLVLSLAAYNAGPGLVSRTGGVPEIPETQHYIELVLKRYKIYKASW